MLDKYSNSQKLFYDYFMKSNASGHVLHAYLIETRGVSYGLNLALDLAKFFLCNGVYDETICRLIDSGNYPNLKIIGNAGNVKKEEIVSLKSDFSMKSIDDKKQVYIICDSAKLNKSAANSLLKFLEEPEEDVIAILLCESAINVLSTIVSRCQVLTLINDDNVYDGIFTSLYDDETADNYSGFVKNYVNKCFEMYLNFENKGVSLLADSSFYDVREFVYEFLCCGYYLYYDALNYLLNRELNCSSFYVDIKKIAEMNDTHDIIRKMEIIDKFINDYKYNVNINLFLDNFIISMGSV